METEPDRDAWPEMGRVGRITKGDLAGRWVLLVAEDYDEFWTYYISGSLLPGTAGPDFYFDGDSIAADLCKSWAVRWADAEDDATIEEAEFGMRRHWPSRGTSKRSALGAAFRRSWRSHCRTMH